LQVRRLRDCVIKLVDGSHNPPAKQDRGRPMLSARNIEDGKIVFDDFRYISEESFKAEHVRTRVTPGDVLLTIVGTIGRSAVVPEGVEPFALQRSVAVLSPKNDLLPKFLAYQLQSPRIQRHFEQHARGTAQKGVYLKTLGETPLFIPPMREQRSIVAEIEKQFSRLDEAVANLRRVKVNLTRYTAAILKAAVEGRLVSTEAELARREGRVFETGAELLERICAVRRASWKGPGKYRAPASPDSVFELKVPEGWTAASLDQLSSRITSGSRDWSKYYGQGKSIFVLAQNVRPFAPDFSVRQLVDPPASDPSRERSRVLSGDLLVTIVGANTGQVCHVYTAPEDAYVCQSVALIRPVTSEIGPYLNFWLNSKEHGRRYFERCMYGQGRPHLSFDQLMATPIALPPIAEQLRIATEVDRHLSIIRETEAERHVNLRRAAALRQATVQLAFEASLGGQAQGVAQDAE
jgi:type I restriction enzyme S subunit